MHRVLISISFFHSSLEMRRNNLWRKLTKLSLEPNGKESPNFVILIQNPQEHRRTFPECAPLFYNSSRIHHRPSIVDPTKIVCTLHNIHIFIYKKKSREEKFSLRKKRAFHRKRELFFYDSQWQISMLRKINYMI